MRFRNTAIVACLKSEYNQIYLVKPGLFGKGRVRKFREFALAQGWIRGNIHKASLAAMLRRNEVWYIGYRR
jgi:hypothetical protein